MFLRKKIIFTKTLINAFFTSIISINLQNTVFIMSHSSNFILHPDWEKAKKHGYASKIGFKSEHSDVDICYCCSQSIIKEPISLNENTKQLQFLGFGFPLYYSFVRNCIFLLFVCVCSYNIIALSTAIDNNFNLCHQTSPQKGDHHLLLRQHESSKEHEKCLSWMVNVSRIEKQVTKQQIILRLFSFMIHFCLLIYIRDKLTKMRDYFDERKTSPSDYTVLVDNIPKVDNTINQIYQVLARDLNTDREVISQIILIPQLERFQKLEHEKQAIVKQLKKVVSQKKSQKEIQQLNQKLTQSDDIQLYKLKAYEDKLSLQQKYLVDQFELKEEQIKDYIGQVKRLYKDNKINSQKALVILNTEEDKQSLLEKFEQKGFKSPEWAETIIQEAPEPRQIIWENIFISKKTNAQLTALGWALSISVLIIITVVFAILSKKKSEIVQRNMEEYREKGKIQSMYFAQLFVGCIIFLIVLFNKMGISSLFHFFTDIERHSNTNHFQFSFCLKYSLGLFFTTALMTLIVEAFMLKNYYQHDFGVIQEETIMYFVNSLFVPLFWLINPSYLYKKYKIWRNFGKMNIFTQQQANALMQQPHYDVGKRYAQVIQIVWFTFLYMTLIPIGGIISAIGLGLYYWIDKYNLLRRSSVEFQVSGQLIHLTLKLLDLTLFMRVVGQIIFDYQIRKGANAVSWILLGLSIVYMLLPIGKIIDFFNNQKFNAEQCVYQEAKAKFTSKYEDQHILFSNFEAEKVNLAFELFKGLGVTLNKP